MFAAGQAPAVINGIAVNAVGRVALNVPQTQKSAPQ